MKKIFFTILIGFIFFTTKAQINFEYFLAVGRYKLFENDYVESIKYLNTAIMVNGKSYDAYFFRALAKYSLSDFSGARIDFDKSIEIQPLSKWALYYRAIALNQLGEHHLAEKDLELVLKIDPLDVNAHINYALTKLQKKDYAAAEKQLNEAIALNPKNDIAFLNRAIVKMYRKDFESAIDDCNKAVRINQFNEDAFIRRGMSHHELKQYDYALMDYEFALKLNDENPLTFFAQALSHLELGDTTAAMSDYNTVIRLDPNNALTYYNRGILKSIKADWMGAIQDYTAVLKYNPENVYTLYNRGLAKMEVQDYSGAANDFTEAIKNFPDFAYAYMARAAAKERLNDRWGAFSDQDTANSIMKRMENTNDSTYLAYADSANLRRIVEFDAEFTSHSQMEGRIEYQDIYIDREPLFFVTCFASNEAYIKSRRSESWDEEFKTFNNQNPYHLNFGIVKCNNNTELDQLLEMLEEKDISDNDVFLQSVIQGIASFWAGDISSAIQSFDVAINIDSDEGYTWFNRGVLKALQTRTKEAEHVGIESFEKSEIQKPDYSEALYDMSQAIMRRPKWAAAWFNRGNIKSYAGDLNGAIADYTKAIELQPLMAEAYYNRGLLLIYLKRSKEACPDLSQAGELGITPAYNVIKRYCK